MKIHIRIDEENERHTKITVFVDGVNCGNLCLLTVDWREIRPAVLKAASHHPTHTVQITNVRDG